MKTVLNLIPPERKDMLITTHAIAHVQRLSFFSLLFALLLAGTFVTLRMLLSATRDDLMARSIAAEAGDAGDSDVRGINSYLGRLVTLTARQTRWSDVLDGIAAMTPKDVRLTRVAFDASGIITVSGTGATRDAVLTMRDALTASGTFKDIKSPISNILRERDVKFDFTMRLVRPDPPPLPGAKNQK